jgi:hypothetical protein
MFKSVGTRAAGAAAVVAGLCLSGCGAYLHDAGLETATTKISSTYTSADPRTTMTRFVERQRALDEAEIAAILDNERAARDRAVADLLVGRGQSLSGVERLSLRIDDDLQFLVGLDRFQSGKWEVLVDVAEKIQGTESTLELKRRNVQGYADAYTKATHRKFAACDKAGLAQLSATAEVGTPEWRLYQACSPIVTDLADLAQLNGNIAGAAGAGGDLRATLDDLAEVAAELKTEADAKKAAADDLKAANDALAASEKRLAPEARVTAELQHLRDLVGKYDHFAAAAQGVPGAAAAVGGLRELGESLAAIEFKKQALGDVLAASADGDSPASQRQRQIVGLLAGILKIEEAGQIPSVAELSLKLAAQKGVEQTAEVRVQSLTARRDLLAERRDAQHRQLEQLARAKLAAEAARTAKDPGCRELGLGAVLQSRTCPRLTRDQVAEALTAYTTSWAAGRTPARTAGRRATHQIAWIKLRTDEEALKARVEVQSIALAQLSAAGAGGVKPSEIAGFLNALGIASVAFGVN